MSRIFIYAALCLLLVSCQKNKGDDSTPPIDPGKSYAITLEIPDQIVRTKVENSTLKMDHYEKVHILVDPAEYNRSWALSLDEDYSGTSLHNVDYVCMNEYGTLAFNWKAGNLNNVHTSQKSVIDTTVGGTRYKKVKVERIIQFFKQYPSQQAATDRQNQLLQTVGEKATFKSFYTYTGVNSLPIASNGTLVYVKGN